MKNLTNHGDVATVLAHLTAIIPGKHAKTAEKLTPVLEYISAIGGQLVDEKETEPSTWATAVKPFVTVVVGDVDAEKVVEGLRKRSSPGVEDEAEHHRLRYRPHAFSCNK